MDLGYYVLYLHHGFGNKRIVRLERTINEYLDRAQSENEMKTETLAELLKVRYGIDVQKEINLIPMQQLIRIYQRNNPLTINDTRQLLNDTAYSYMALACTALKLMFKLSVREIKEFIAEFRDLIDTLYKFNQFGLTLPKVAQCLAKWGTQFIMLCKEESLRFLMLICFSYCYQLPRIGLIIQYSSQNQKPKRN